MDQQYGLWRFWRNGAARLPSLRLCIAGVILLVLLPTLGVVAITLFNAGLSYRDGSVSRMMETAHVVAQSVESERDSASRMIRAYALMTGHSASEEAERRWLSQSFGDGEFHQVLIRRQGTDFTVVSGAPGEELAGLARAAARKGEPQLSNLISSAENPRPSIALAVAAPENAEGMVEVDLIVVRPDALMRPLARQGAASQSVTLAVTDGSGRIIGRSRDAEKFLGRPVPDWQALMALGTSSGLFEARTIEGQKIVFAFQRIAGTPGWVAVVGEPLTLFNSRWQKPIAVMAAASAATIFVASLLAWLLVRNILKPIRLLADHARLVSSTRGEGEAVDVPPSYVAEFETLRQSLAASEAELRRSIAESRAAEQAAEKSLAAMRRAERLARIGSWTLNLETLEFNSSDMLHVLNGADPNGPAVTINDLQRLTSPEDFERINAAMDNCIANGEPYRLEVTHLREDGSHFPAMLRGGPVFGENGELIALAGTVQDVSERHEQMARLAMLADNLPSGAVFRLERGATGKLVVSYISAGIEKMTGVPPGEMIDSRESLLGLMVSEDRTAYETALASFIDRGNTFNHEFRVNARDGRLVWLRLRAARHDLLDGRTVWDGILLDITAEKASAQALEAAKEKAEDAERAKSDFLATMSHEIRTPMNAVIGMTRLTLQTDLTAKQRNYLEKIDTSARLLLGIINDILDYSKIEADGMKLEQTDFTLESVLESVSVITALRAEEKQLEVIFSVAPDVPPVIIGDPLRLGQVLTNLVSNAVKFTEKGEIAISVETVPGAKKPMLRFGVRDTGIGLEADQIARLFRPFSQAERATSRKYGGTGLGLAISKRLVEMMGGEIGVTSEPGVGTTFSFTMAAPPAIQTRPATAIPERLKGKRVLIVDDNESARMALAEMLNGLGVEIDVRASGMEALALLHERALANRPFDVVLMDWRMPHLDGLETARRMRADGALAKMPAVLMVTAYGREEILQGAEQVGLQGVLIKPVTQSVMYNTMLDLLVPADGNELPAMPATGTDVAADMRMSLSGRRVLLADDNALNREVATDFLHAVGMVVETACNGAEALEKLAAGNFDVVLLDVHMPVMGGLEAAREIRRNPVWASLPVISLTAQASQEDRQASLDAGMTAHLTKPIDETALYSTLADVLSAGDVIDGAGSPVPASVEPEHPATPVDLPAILRRFNGNEERVRRLLQGFTRDFADVPVTLDRLLAAKDLDSIAMLAHQMKGSAAYLEAKTFCRIAERLETAARDGDGTAVSAQAGGFRDRLVELLAAVNAISASLVLVATVPAGGDVQRLIADAKPLVESGDYAAMSLLEGIATQLAGDAAQALVRKVQAYFEDLELVAALDALEQLERMVTGTGGAAP